MLGVAHARPAAAQSDGTAIIYGVVVDSAGVPIADANVVVGRSDGAFVRRAVTDGRGAYRASLLLPGVYNITAQRIDYVLALKRNVLVESNRSLRVDLVLRRRALDLPEVTVTAKAPVGQQKGAEVGITRVTAEEIAKLPVGTDVDRVVAMAPGARGSSLWGAAGTQANNYQLDGVAINNPGVGGAFMQPSIRWIDRLEVKGLGADAEQGNYQGGVINVITKSGSNARHGSIEGSAQSQSLNGSNLLATSLVPEIAGRRQAIGQLSGPIVRDRLFFYLGAEVTQGDYRAIDHLVATPFTFVPFVQTKTDSKVFGKFTVAPTENDLLNLSVARNDRSTDHGDFTGREAIEATTHLTAPTTVVNGTWNHQFNSATRIETKLLGFDGRELREPSAGGSVPGIYTYELTTTRSYQNSPFTTDQKAHSLGGTVALDRYQEWSGIQHHFRTGGEYSDATWRDLRTRNAGMTWRPRYNAIDGSDKLFDPADALTWQTQTPTTWGGEADFASHTVNAAGFVQDEVKLGSVVTLYPGLRAGSWRGDVDPTARGVSTRTNVLNDAGLDPRFGITLDIPDPDTPVRLAAHVGRYHQSAFGELFDRAREANAYTDQQVWEYSGPAFSDPTRVITLAERDALAKQGQFKIIENVVLSQAGEVKDYHQPYVNQFSAGMEVRFGERHWRGEFLFVSRDNRNLVGIVDRNIEQNFRRYDYVYAFDRSGKPVLDSYGKALILPSVYIPVDAIAALVKASLANPGASFPFPPGVTVADSALKFVPDYVITNPPDARRQLRQWQLNFDAEYPTWTGSLSAAFSGLSGNFSSVTGYDQLSIGGFEGIVGRGPGPYVRPNEAINYDGTLDNNSFLTLKGRTIVDMPYGFHGGVIAEYISGDRKSPQFIEVPSAFTLRVLGTTELFPILTQAISRQRIYTRPQGTDHYEGRYTVDLHLEREFISSFATWTVQADAFNILNSGEITLSNTALNSNTDPNALTRYGAPLERQLPRQLQVGIAAAW
ncbi:MAG: TonB-dependent receptor [Gemmatimonadota bacterium]|nr:TonB-dependent receptor [Gemmatimonadota bacterium]